jgi:exosortase A
MEGGLSINNLTPHISRSSKGTLISVLVGSIVIGVGLFFWSTTSVLLSIWQNLGYQHSYVVPFVSAYLLWQQKPVLAELLIKPSGIGVLALTSSCLLWFVAHQTLIQLVEQLSLVLIMASAVWAVLGFQIFRASSFPLFFLMLAVPIGAELVPVLVDITASLSIDTLQLIGFSVYREGSFLIMPNGSFHVADACSGFKYLFSGLTISILLSHITFEKLSSKIAFVLVSIPYYILLNSIRAIVVIIVAHESNMSVFVGEEHIWFGWLLFAVAVYVQFVAAHLLQKKQF